MMWCTKKQELKHNCLFVELYFSRKAVKTQFLSVITFATLRLGEICSL